MATVPTTRGTQDAPARHPLRTAWARAIREPVGARSAALAAGAALVAGGYVLMLLDRETLHPLINEEGWVETAGALALAAASALFLTAALGPVRPRAVRAGLGLLALAFAFGAGEEVSWGERRLGLAAPGALIAENAQGEANLHNLAAIDGSVDDLFTAFVLAFAIALPLVAAAWPGFGARARRAVPVLPAGLALLFLVNEATFRLVWWGMPRGWYEGIHPFSQSAHEIRETTASILFGLAALALAAERRRRAPGAADGEIVRRGHVETARPASTSGCTIRHPEEDPVKFVILIHSNPASREMWEGFSEQEKAEGFRYYGTIVEDLVASGELIVTEALADPSLARTVTVGEAGAMATDGPFAEAKEQLAGFFLIDCETPERAVKIAARMPEAHLGLIEVRPVLDLGGLEM